MELKFVPSALVTESPSADECGKKSLEMYEVLEPTVADRYERGSVTCSVVSDEPGEVYPAGPQIDISELPLIEAVSVGSEHVNVRFHTAGGVALFPSGALVDSETGEWCTDELFSDGVLRCASRETWARSASWFVDSTCSEQPIIAYAVLAASACVEQTLPSGVLLLGDDAECPRKVVRAGRLEPFAGDAFYQRTEDGCEPVSAADYPDLDLYQMGEEVEPDEAFGRIEIVEAP